MKQVIAAIILVFLVSGCSSSAQETDSSLNSEQAAEKEESSHEEDISSEKKLSTDKEDSIEKGKRENNTSAPVYEIQESNWTVIPKNEEEDSKKVLITIDDAPDKYSVEMAKTLKEHKVPAIFFVNGHFIQDQEGREQLKKIYELGFEIGNHTMNHSNLNDLTKEETKKEIIKVNDLVEDITGERPTYFRAPFGVNTEVSKEILQKENMIWMNWTYGYDWESEYMEAAALADIMINTQYLTDGANLLMHDREWTNNALESIVKGFRDKGFGFIDPEHIEKN